MLYRLVSSGVSTDRYLGGLPLNRRTKYLYVEEQITDIAARVELPAFDPIDNLDMNSIIEMCSNLKGLDFHDSELGIEMAILQAIGHRLEYLTLYDLNEVAISVLKDVNFANLQQLVQGGPHGLCSDDSLRFILKTAVNLEKVDVECKPELIAEILTKCEQLKYLKIACDHARIGHVLDVMAHYFEQKNQAFKETLKIGIHCYLEQRQERIVSKFDRVVNSLSATKVDQWMIILYLPGRSKDELQRKLIWNSDVARSFEVGDVFVITNPNCTINGLRESWLM